MPRKEKTYATVDDHMKLIEEVLGTVRRDVFSGDLCYFDTMAKRWISVLDDVALGTVKTIAVQKAEQDWIYKPTILENVVHYMTKDKTKELLVEIPGYDGEDRIGAIANAMKPKNISKQAVEQILKQWCGRVMTRIYEPQIQNHILVLSGGQGIGKDHLCKTLCGGLGQFFVPFLIQQQERDTYQQLISGLVCWISEYDRTNKTEVATLKNMITADRAYFRSAYGRKPNYYTVRASFISTTNVDGILRDWTGNRRYHIIELEGIDWNYPQGKEHEMQILAQMKQLHRDGYTASDGALAEMAEYIEGQTPENPENILVDDYRNIFNDKYPLDDGMKASEMDDLWVKMNRIHGLNINYMRSVVKRKGFAKRVKDGIRYYKNLVAVPEEYQIEDDF